MDPADVFERCAEHRVALADWLESLDDDQLATPSLCGGWDVRTVAAHLTVPINVPRLVFVTALLRARGNFHRANDAVARSVARRPVGEIAATLRRKAGSTATPPVGGPRAPLTDLLVHGGDMRIPLGVPFAPPLEDLAVALDFLSSAGIGFIPRGLLRGVRLAPTDIDRTWGDGAEVSGTAADVLLGVCGRRVALDRLTGPGTELLAART